MFNKFQRSKNRVNGNVVQNSCSQDSQHNKLMFQPASLLMDTRMAFQAELDAAKAKEEAEQRKRQYEENVRLGLVKKKGRKSKAQIEKEKKEERRRLRREKKEQRRREKREHREKEGVTVEPKERKSRKERRERKREKKERKENERKEREKLAAEKKEVVGEKKERKPRKPRDPNAPRKPRQPVGPFILVSVHRVRACRLV
uniref:Vicilin-like seed storage protein At2g18540 n=1 Tax=Ascaris lumbricoides TaxID=6252 RepID=A0A0M3HRA9_ASCLU